MIAAVRAALDKGGHDPELVAAVEVLLASCRNFSPEAHVKAWYMIDARETDHKVRVVRAARDLTGLDIQGSVGLVEAWMREPSEFVYTTQQYNHDCFVRVLRRVGVEVALVAAAEEGPCTIT